MIKRIGLSLIVGIVTVLATVGVGMAADTTGAAAETKRETVFMDMAWGDPVEKLRDAVLSNELKNNLVAISQASSLERRLRSGISTKQEPQIKWEVYQKRSEMLSIGALPIETIVYGFIDGRLTAIRVATANPKQLLDIMHARYGEPNVSQSRTREDEWNDKLTDIMDKLNWDLAWIEVVTHKRKDMGPSLPEVTRKGWRQGDTLIYFWGHRWGYFELWSEPMLTSYQRLIEAQQKKETEAYNQQIQQDTNAW